MNERSFAALEYDGLRALVRQHAQTALGRSLVDRLAPLADLETVRCALRAVSECRALHGRGVRWSFADLADPTEALARLRVEGTALDPASLLNLAHLCARALDVRAAMQAERELCPTLWQIAAAISPALASIAAQITAKILPSGELDDRASPELARIRARLNHVRSSLTRMLEGVLRRFPDAVQDAIVTVRNDRFVIPIRVDHRGRIAGVAHGFSSSGATVFLEPLEAVEPNNELQALREEEEREKGRILLALSDELRGHLIALEQAVEAVAELDLVRAKALFAEQFDAIEPVVEADGPLEFIEARHPLLEEELRRAGERRIVPVSFKLDAAHPVMIISGANAGGKTVVLKTAGLLALMALSGIHVPARRAHLPLYRSILADIGDQQSLTANLSTFTSHIANISHMIESCQAPALVLLDEVGTGTDPEEGSALGVAIVDHFRRVCGAHVIATTHYSGLKIYAASEPGVINASVEFDEKTLQPTYRLIIGLPGASAGLEIARRFGLPEGVIEAARRRVSEESRAIGEYLRHLRSETELIVDLRRALEEEREAVAAKYHALEAEFERRERERQQEFAAELRRVVADFEGRARALVAKIEDRITRERAAREAEKRAAELRRTARAVEAQREVQTEAVGAKTKVRVVRRGRKERAIAPARPIAVGDRVRLVALGGAVGIVESLSGEQAEVRTGALRFREKVANLELIEGAEEQPHAPSIGTEFKLRAADRQLREELNLIGRTTDEVAEELDRFLDEAYLNDLDRVRIIHGHGTGALRRAVAAVLQFHPHVARFSLAPPEEGGAGATIVELKR